MVLLLFTTGCVSFHITNVDTTANAYLSGEKPAFHNGEDFIEVTVGAGDSVDQGVKTATGQTVKVVYHLTNGLAEAQRALGQILSHLAADPSVKIVVVANDKGIEFLLEGAKDESGKLFMPMVHDIKAKGVEFHICNDSLTTQKIDKSKVIAEATIVPLGVVEVSRLQFVEGYAYLRP